MATIEKGFKYRIYPNKTQEEQLQLMFKAKRFIWNHFLKLNMDKFEKKEKLLTYNQMSSLLTQFKKENVWLSQCEKSILQKSLSRKQNQSKNRNKQRLRLNKYHKKIYNCRVDFIHKLSTDLIRNYDVICLEDLNTSKIIKNHKLAKSIADASFFEFTRQLGYKAKWNYKYISIIDRFYPSSQICSCCGNQDAQTKDLGVRTYICDKCGLEIDRDYNASINILNEGLRVMEQAKTV